MTKIDMIYIDNILRLGVGLHGDAVDRGDCIALLESGQVGP